MQGLLASLLASPEREPVAPPAGQLPIGPLAVEGPALGTGADVELSQRIPLLFGMGAIPTQESERLSVDQLREARERGDRVLEQGGLRGRGLLAGGRARSRPAPVLRVGFPRTRETGELLPGLADVAFERTALLPQDPSTGAPRLDTQLFVDAESGELRRTGPTGPIVGRVIAHPVNGPITGLCERADCPGWRVGDVLSFSPGVPRVSGPAYVPIYEATRCDRVLGYVAAQLLVEAGANVLQLQPLPSGWVAENASAVPDPSLAAAREDLVSDEGDCTLQVADVQRLGDSVPLVRVAALGRSDTPAPEAP